MGTLCFTKKKFRQETTEYKCVKVIDKPDTRISGQYAVRVDKIEVNSNLKVEIVDKVQSLPSRIGTIMEEPEGDSQKVNISASLFVNEKNITTLQRDYEQLEDIGQGAFGKVKKVRHKPTNTIRALKIIRKEKFNTAGNEAVLRREIEILKRLVKF